ncbi:RNA polymerase sigma factor SigY [Bacillus sp. T33-2]|uniref:RNA polymerase sigma factor SigY n=1 Tax=Bacillus sp. T33-2 TaxID=2054168 RepID=UPI000C7663AA|nr:RNA polymerase sigma factor SigY [Bacillus sp. T33-2]PLR89927.1 RNA polymerase sigma factor SigY [Bacillus sp. T33-2]
MEEKDLIFRAKQGDHRSFAELFRMNYPFLVKYLIKVTMNPETAEDLAQETMAKCVEKIHLYNGKAKFSSWLISIATNQYIDQLRKQKREKAWSGQQKSYRKLKWHVDSNSGDWHDALNALGKLRGEARIPIVLKHYYGYSYDEIGGMMGISPGTVKSRVHHGLLEVRKELALDGRPKR